MKATTIGLLCLALFGVLPSEGIAQPHPLIPQAPDAFGPGFYCVNHCGALYGPNWHLRPCHLPWNGAVFAPPCPVGPNGQPFSAKQIHAYVQQYARAHGMSYVGVGAGHVPPPTFPVHPFARSPRDFFMVGDNDLERR